MQRRDFLKTSGALVAAAAITPPSVLAQAPSGSRLVLPINRGWRYKPSKVEGAVAPSFDDSGFERVTLPHTNIRLPWHNFDDRDYEFISTYRRRFRLPQNALAGKRKRVFVDFEGVMTATTVFINGHNLGEYKGGYTPFSFELTPHLTADGDNVLTLHVDSTERADIPPFGYQIDYMTFGGLYREVALRVVPDTFLDNIHAEPKDMLSATPSLDVHCFLGGTPTSDFALEAELLDGDRVIAKATQPARPASGTVAPLDPETTAPVYLSQETRDDPAMHTVSFDKLRNIQLWTLEQPKLYTVRVRLLQGGAAIDEDTRRIGFREAKFTPQGFSLNGKIVKLRGLDRHQTFPFVGLAMPARVQRQDVKVLRKHLHCNIVRTSHYPQSRHFLDACDEMGLLVLEEIPGWQHIGPEPWKLIAIDNVGRMIRRDWNHPSIILWGVRINESRDDHAFYTRTNALAHALDDSRQTGGIRNFKESELLEDVFTINDFGFPLREPNHPLYLNTEFVGHTYPVKTTDDDERQREHTLRHARIHDQLASNPQYSGGIGWCAFDYNTHADFGAGDRICYHGITDIFREPKAAAGFYKSQCEPEEEIVLEPAFHWAQSDEATTFRRAVVCTNCDHLKWYIRSRGAAPTDWKLVAELDPDREEFKHLKYPPFQLALDKIDWDKLGVRWGDLRIDGYRNGKQVISRTMSGDGVDSAFTMVADDQSLVADGADTTRVVLRVTDAYGNARPYADAAFVLSLDGPAELIGESPFFLAGGQGAVWIRAKQQPGTVKLTATHSRLGTKNVQLRLTPAADELA
jgi:beta-galactosidase